MPFYHPALSGRAINTVRFLYHSNDAGRSNPPSAINLNGCWLEECGFITGMPVTVAVERGRIIIETQINL
ncbi:SymE family type I addiction module toxin [Pectobacterium wasabiae]|uniref:SymE family type I addiction module toxin n=1 Tax=Pectobacterium wasabiae TaxID=55208 RepID=UPI0008FB00B9|nr:SymE family type I addiction module toxin [Pectobacterium wasabiae]